MPEHYYVEDHEDGTLKANGAGGFPRTDRQPLVVGALTGTTAQLDDQDSTRLVVGPLQTGETPHGHGHAGVNDQAVADGHVIAVPHEAATLTSSGNAKSLPNRQKEDDVNLVAFESRVARNGRGAPDTVVPPLKAQSGQTGKGDAAPMVFGMSRAVTMDTPQEGTGAPLRGNQNCHAADSVIAGPEVGVRRLTPIECEKLQGFPPDWTAIDGDQTPDGKRYAALGDAVTVPVAEWLARRLMRYGQ